MIRAPSKPNTTTTIDPIAQDTDKKEAAPTKNQKYPPNQTQTNNYTIKKIQVLSGSPNEIFFFQTANTNTSIQEK